MHIVRCPATRGRVGRVWSGSAHCRCGSRRRLPSVGCPPGPGRPGPARLRRARSTLDPGMIDPNEPPPTVRAAVIILKVVGWLCIVLSAVDFVSFLGVADPAGRNATLAG